MLLPTSKYFFYNIFVHLCKIVVPIHIKQLEIHCFSVVVHFRIMIHSNQSMHKLGTDYFKYVWQQEHI